MAPARWNLFLSSRYDDSIARAELLPLNAVTDMSGQFSGVLIVGKIHKDSTLQVGHLSYYFVLCPLMRWRPPRCQNTHFFLRLGGGLFERP